MITNLRDIQISRQEEAGEADVAHRSGQRICKICNLRHQHPRYSIVSKITFTISTKSSAKLLDSKIVRKSLRVLHPRHREMGGAGCVQRGSLEKVDNETKISIQWQNPFKATDTCLKTPLTIMWKGNGGGISTGRAEKVFVSLLLPFLWSWWWWLSSPLPLLS